jgi:hypothetical protein
LPARDFDPELAENLTSIAELAASDAAQPADALDAEQWASSLLGAMRTPAMMGEDVEAMFRRGFIAALEDLGTSAALATLRALVAVGAPDYAARACAAADGLAAAGLPEPAWAADLATARPTAAALMYEEAFDDGLSVMVEFAAPDIQTHTIGIYIDHNMGGLVKDVFLAGPLSEVRKRCGRRAPNQVGLAIRDLDLAEARARVEAAFDMLDNTYDPPVNEDVRPLRALIEARIRRLPEGFELPDDYVEVRPDEREALLEDFLSSPEGQRWRGDEDAEDVVRLAIDFGAGYNHGGPLRWSPVVVEIFMTSWLARKVTREPGFFEGVPEVLCDWVKYAGRRQGVPSAPLREAVAAVGEYRQEMLDAIGDPHAWGPAKTFAIAALDAGVDLGDRDQVERFIERYNAGLAA